MFIAVNTSFGQSRIGGKVVGVIDGKTVSIEMPNGSQLIAVLQYIEVPEPEQPLHKIAAEHLSALVLDKKVEFRARSITPLKTAGSLFVNNIDIGQQMIRDGAAWYAILEKSGQEAAESATYQSNEALAKTEKRGVWSFENLKPSWEIRAEAEENRRRQERIKLEEAAKMSASAEETPRPPKPVIKRQLNSDSQLWTDLPETKDRLPENFKNVGGLLVGHNAKYNFGMVATPPFRLEVSDKDNRQAVAISIFYFYGEDKLKGQQKIYMITVESESRDWTFLKFNELTATGENLKINFGKAKRFAYERNSVRKEVLSYRIKRSDLAKIANAENVSVKVGNYSTKVSRDIQMMLGNLLNLVE